MSVKSRSFFKDKYNLSPVVIAKKFRYSQTNIDILNYENNDDEKFQLEHPIEYNMIKKANHMRDNRTIVEFAKDMVNNWLIEDFIKLKLSDKDITISLNGTDSERKFNEAKNVRTTADYVIDYKGYTFTVELVCDYANYWCKNHQLALRDNKAKKLHEREDLLLAIDLLNDGFYLIDFKYIYNFNDALPIPAYGFKPGIVYDLRNFNGYILNKSNFKYALDQIIKNDKIRQKNKNYF